MPDQERRSNVDFTGSQSGDHTARDAAGRDIVYQGLDPTLLRYLEGERNSRDALAAIVIEVRKEIADMRLDAHKADRDAAMERGIDFDARLKRQAALDARLDALERRFTWMAAVVFVALIVVLGLLSRELAWLAARATFDALALTR